ncbi:uncharacterized protein BCR38DRAFT_319 [Pseudomassariella vexata]|uniref:Uncharacterized protein n=1 Tax=Pseudomassariella vexata TaxID=1141098 RepID=A0A1Y2EI14_9PEZI|nr:uncharacterized protein BCR38DRAFT_319 [Pseudomassariella vexata]ORY70886.1 hypothetical protein BCR38DRAFT_319 [Pseudomassariella vexata]
MALCRPWTHGKSTSNFPLQPSPVVGPILASLHRFADALTSGTVDRWPKPVLTAIHKGASYIRPHLLHTPETKVEIQNADIWRATNTGYASRCGYCSELLCHLGTHTNNTGRGHAAFVSSSSHVEFTILEPCIYCLDKSLPKIRTANNLYSQPPAVALAHLRPN